MVNGQVKTLADLIAEKERLKTQLVQLQAMLLLIEDRIVEEILAQVENGK